MQISESLLREDLERRAETYAPLFRWCELLFSEREPGEPKSDMDAEFYRALDQVVRRNDFSIEDVRELLEAQFCSYLDDPSFAAYCDELCARAKIVREFVEARGVAKISRRRRGQ